MPFESKSQWRAAFAGKIPGISKQEAKEWARKTDYSSLPEKKAGYADLENSLSVSDSPRLRSRGMLMRNLRGILSREKRSFAENCGSILATKVAKDPHDVGRIKGVATPDSLKPPGKDPKKQAINPRRNSKQSFTAFMS